MRILITGGAGFIGCNFVRYILKKYSDSEIVVLDKLTYAGHLENLQDVRAKIEFIKGDICKKNDVERAIKECRIVFNFAAETHVDRSIKKPLNFIKTDILGTYTLLEAVRKYDIEKYIQISTDEVYGSADNRSFKEEDLLKPSSPYSSSKAGADLLAGAYHSTYGLPVLIARSTNNFGPYQYPEKLIPLFIINALLDKQLPLYGSGLNIRDWIYVMDNCSAIDLVYQRGKTGDIYNIAAGNEKTNLEVTKFILSELGKPHSLIKFVQDRPGHDLRYSLDFTKIKKLGWKPAYDFETSMKTTIKWYKENELWWRPLLKGK